MKKNSPLKIFCLIAVVLIAVGFFESSRLIRFLPSAPTAPADRAALWLARKSESIKTPIRSYLEKPHRTADKLEPSDSATPSALPDLLPLIASLPPLPRFAPPAPPYSVLIVGDSFIAERLGPELEKTLASFQDVSVRRVGIYSTGLTRPDYFSWNEKLETLIAENNPNVAIVMFGANDAQDAYASGTLYAVRYGTSDWDALYEARVKSFLSILQNHRITTFWIGNPMPRAEVYKEKMARLNRHYATAAAASKNALFISNWTTLANASGTYAEYLPDENEIERRVRASDGIHPTPFGAGIMTRFIVAELQKYLILTLPPKTENTPAAP